jgi:hypothetical protein
MSCLLKRNSCRLWQHCSLRCQCCCNLLCAGKDALPHVLNLVTSLAAPASMQQSTATHEQQQGCKPHLCITFDSLTPLLQHHTPHQVARLLLQLQSHPAVSCILAAVHMVSATLRSAQQSSTGRRVPHQLCINMWTGTAMFNLSNRMLMVSMSWEGSCVQPLVWPQCALWHSYSRRWWHDCPLPPPLMHW